MSQTELIDRYVKGIDVLADAVRDVNPAVLDKIPAPGKWSIRQYLMHLVDADIVNSTRIRQLVAQPGGNLVGFDQERWTETLHYEKQPVGDALAAFKGLRLFTANLLRTLQDDVWQHKGVHPRRGEMTLIQAVELVTNHCENHSKTIRELRQRFSTAAKA